LLQQQPASQQHPPAVRVVVREEKVEDGNLVAHRDEPVE
jgi:hypothetical protein